MKNVLLTLLACLPFTFLLAQNCTPDPAYQDSTGVFPAPYDADINPTGGITECAVIGQDYEFPLTVAVGDSITVPFGGASLTFALDNIIVDDVLGLPEGISYFCEPSACKYENNTLGCVALKGVPTATNAPGDYDLTIKVTINFIGFPFTLPFTFPDANIAPGKYTLKLLGNASDPCGPVGTKEQLADKVEMTIQPNPSSGPVNIKINADIIGEFDLHVVDLLGRLVHQKPVVLQEGANFYAFDGSHLTNGLYFLVLENELGSVAQKMTIQH